MGEQDSVIADDDFDDLIEDGKNIKAMNIEGNR